MSLKTTEIKLMLRPSIYLAYLSSTDLLSFDPCCLESQWAQSWRMEPNYGCELEESWASCLGWRSEETGWLVLNDLWDLEKKSIWGSLDLTFVVLCMILVLLV